MKRHRLSLRCCVQLSAAASITAGAGRAWASGHAGADLRPLFFLIGALYFTFGVVPWLASWWLLRRKRSFGTWFFGTAGPCLGVGAVLRWEPEPRWPYVFLAVLPAVLHLTKLVIRREPPASSQSPP
jgi:hypothetical protein